MHRNMHNKIHSVISLLSRIKNADTEAGWNAVPTTKNIITAVAPQLNIKADFDLEKQKSIVDAAYKKEISLKNR